MYLKMLETKNGCEEGSHVTTTYEEGESYHVGEELAKVFLKNKWAKETKAVKKAPEDKEIKGAAEDKGKKKK